MSYIIEARGLTKIYKNAGGDHQTALKDVNLKITQGESLAIIGKSGSGKSTLMHILATLDKPTSGTLLIQGKDTTEMGTGEIDTLRNKTFGFVFQQFFINARNSCLENVILPLNIMGISPRERKNRGRKMLEAIGLLDKANQKAGELSGGQKQRVCIARALITQPRVIFADEPTGNLDTENGQNITDLLFRLQKEKNITLVVVTHDTDMAALCDRSIIIKDGHIQ